MASRFAGSKEIISIWLWIVVMDGEGYVYAKKTTHIGDYTDWQLLITNRINGHLLNVGVEGLIANRISRDVEITKENHLIKTDSRCQGDRIGIAGDDEMHIRKDKFSYIR